MIAYLNDILLIGKTKEETERAFRTTVTLLEELDFVHGATQVIEFLGFVVDSRSMQFRFPHNKVKAIKKISGLSYELQGTKGQEASGLTRKHSCTST